VLDSPVTAPPPMVFLSYSRKDFAFVVDLHHALGDGPQLHPWLDVVELQGGHDWASRIDAAIASAAFLVLVDSRNSRRSKQVEAELTHATERGIPVVVVRIQSLAPHPRFAERPTYDVRRGFAGATRALRDDLAAGHLRRDTPPPGFPPLAVVLVVAAQLALLGWFVYLSSFAWVPIQQLFAVRLGLFSDFTLRWGPGPIRWMAGAVVAAAAVQGYAAYCVIRRRIRPQLLFAEGLLAAVLVSLNSLYLLAVEYTYPETVFFPGPGLAPRLFVNGVAIAILIGVSRTVSRHPDLRRRVALGSVGAPESVGDEADLAAADEDGEPDEGPPERPDASVGTVAIRYGADDDDLVRVVELLCTRLHFRRVDGHDPPPDKLIILAGPWTGLDRCAAEIDAAGSATAVVFVLVDSMRISVDATELRRFHWVDLRRQDAAAFIDLARALLSVAVPFERIPAPVAPTRFAAPEPATFLSSWLLGQSLVALQFVIAQSTAVSTGAGWRAQSTVVLLAVLVLGVVMADGLLRHSWTSRAFRLCNAVFALVSAAADVAILHAARWSIFAAVLLVLVLALQALCVVGCHMVAGTPWMSYRTTAAPLVTTLRAVSPYAVTGVLLLLVLTPFLVALGPPVAP
jgi:hypothetical protein